MSILQRYALRQFVPPFFLAVVILAFVLLMDRLFLLADLLVRKGVAVSVVSEIMVLSLPFVVSVCTPLGTLIAGVVTFGRMAEDNEIKVIRAAGIPVLRVFLPTAAVCCLLMVVMVGFNGFAVPESQHNVRNLLTDVARKKPALRVREGVFMDDFANYLIYIGTIDERRSRVKNVAIFERRQGKKTPGFVTAPQGEIAYTDDDRYMVLTLYDGEMHELGDSNNYRRLSFRRHVINVALDVELIRRDREFRGDQEMTLLQLLDQIRRLRKDEAEISAKVVAARAEAKSEPGRLKLDELMTRLQYKRLETGRYETEFHKSLSLAFSCFFFVLFGAPLGIVLRRGGIGTGFIVGLVFFAAFYVLLLAGENFADSGKVAPSLGMWLPNIVLTLPVTELAARAFFEKSLVREIVGHLRRMRR
ncbi:MAG: LptF/LptG family permease [candidate division WOR-3 bacterium]